MGTLAVGSEDPDRSFTQRDTESIGMLASTAAAALVALERARLEGARLVARTAKHELNNQLAAARGYAEMLAGAPDLPPHLAQLAAEVINAADDAAKTVRQLHSCVVMRHEAAGRSPHP